LNKKFFLGLIIILLLGISMSPAQETTASMSQEFVIKPDSGIGNIVFGASINEVEEIFGRGELIPEESRQQGFSYANLLYKDQRLVFRFTNGQLTTILIENPDFVTNGGVRVGGSVGDLIREFGPEYNIIKSLLQIPDPDKEEYEMVYRNIRVNIQGKAINKIWIQSTQRIKPFKQK
jgi:hypothetical protein